MFCCFGSRNKKIQIDSSTRPLDTSALFWGKIYLSRIFRLTRVLDIILNVSREIDLHPTKKVLNIPCLCVFVITYPTSFEKGLKKYRMPSSFRNNDLLLAIKSKIESRTFKLFHSFPPFLSTKKSIERE